MNRRSPEKQDRVVSGERAGCYDCDWKLSRPGYAKSSGGLSGACLWHTRTKGHKTWVQVTATTDYVPCVTIGNENGQNKEEDLPSDPRSSERDDVAPVGGVRQDAEVVWGGVDPKGARVFAEALGLNEEDVRRVVLVPGSPLPAPPWDPNNEDEA